MKRDIDLIRELMLDIIDKDKRVYSALSSSAAQMLGIDEEDTLGKEEARKLEHHLNLIEQQGWVAFSRTVGGGWLATDVTWAGHDFADSVRDPEIWKQTKAGAQAAKGFTLDLLGALAKGFVKQKLEKHTGVAIDL